MLNNPGGTFIDMIKLIFDPFKSENFNSYMAGYGSGLLLQGVRFFFDKAFGVSVTSLISKSGLGAPLGLWGAGLAIFAAMGFELN